jgi:antitoxin component YwqK of YwqJK toxin-antitoxin module
MVNGNCKIYENGRLKGEGEMSGLPKNPRKNGIWKEMHPNGKVASEGPYRMDKKIGKFKEYHSNGALKAEGEYMNDKKNGKWTFYKEDGKTVNPELSGSYMMDKLNKKLDMK